MPMKHSILQTVFDVYELLILIDNSGAEICCHQFGIGCFNDNWPFDHLPLPDCIEPNFNLYTRTNRNNVQMVTRTTIP